MISGEVLEQMARQHQTGVYPNLVREYVQHLFLKMLYQLDEAGRMLFKGGTALRIIYGSPRFSEDLDFSLWSVAPRQVKPLVEGLFVRVLSEMEQAGMGVELGPKSNATSGGYFGVATFKITTFPPVTLAINVSTRKGKALRGEVDSIANDFVPTYTLVHLPLCELVEEKIFGALRSRKKPRDFYDLYFMMRKGLLAPDQKKRLTSIKKEIIAEAKKINFRGELGAFLPVNQQAIIRDFVRVLEAEIGRQTGG